MNEIKPTIFLLLVFLCLFLSPAYSLEMFDELINPPADTTKISKFFILPLSNELEQSAFYQTLWLQIFEGGVPPELLTPDLSLWLDVEFFARFDQAFGLGLPPQPAVVENPNDISSAVQGSVNRAAVLSDEELDDVNFSNTSTDQHSQNTPTRSIIGQTAQGRQHQPDPLSGVVVTSSKLPDNVSISSSGGANQGGIPSNIVIQIRSSGQ